jgi:predicted SprT family Zn-dependent metalloprotease
MFIPSGCPRWLKEVLKAEFLDRVLPPDLIRNADGTPKEFNYPCPCQTDNSTTKHHVRQFARAKRRKCLSCGRTGFFDHREF